MAPDTYRFVGYNTLPYQDWLDKQLMSYVSQRNQYGEGGYADPWMTQLMANGSPLGSAASLNQAVQGIGGYGAIGFDPNNVWNSQVSNYAQTGYGLSRDASGNVIEPMFNTSTEGSDLGKRLGLPGGLSFGGSEGEGLGELASLIEMGALSYGGAAAAGATSGTAGASTTAGFGEAGYSGAAGGSAGAATGTGSGYDFGMTGNEGSGLTAANGQPVAGISGSQGSGNLSGSAGNDTLSGGSMSDETGAFDQSGSQGVFDSQGNPIYEQPSWFSQTFGDMSGSDIAKFLYNNKGTIGALLGAGAGAISATSGPAGTVTTTQDVPDWLKPYVQGNVAQGAQTLAGINPNNPLLPASQAQALATIRGDYLNPNTNPYLQANVNDALGLAKSQYLGMYGGPAGLNANNTGFQEGLTRNLGTLATQAYGQNYANERQNQNTATFGAPQLVSQSNAAYFSPNQAFAGLFPNVSSTQTPYFSNPLGGIFGGALAGGALGNAFG